MVLLDVEVVSSPEVETDPNIECGVPSEPRENVEARTESGISVEETIWCGIYLLEGVVSSTPSQRVQ